TVLAAHVAAALGLPGNSPASAEASRNKLIARREFDAAGLLIPAFHVGLLSEHLSESNPVAYPVVVKPLALSGSQGVIRADDQRELKDAIARVSRLLKSTEIAMEREAAHDSVLIEAFIPGREYAIEGVLTEGALQVFAIFDKPDPLDGPFFEETIYVTPSRAPRATQHAIVEAVASAPRAPRGGRHSMQSWRPWPAPPGRLDCVMVPCTQNVASTIGGFTYSRSPLVPLEVSVREPFDSSHRTKAWPLSRTYSCGMRSESRFSHTSGSRKRAG